MAPYNSERLHIFVLNGFSSFNGSGNWSESIVLMVQFCRHIAQTFPNLTSSRFSTILANICNCAHAQFERPQGVPGVRRLELGAWLHGDVGVGADPAEAALRVRPHCLPGPEERSRQNWSLRGGKKTRISLLTLRRMYRYWLLRLRRMHYNAFRDREKKKRILIICHLSSVSIF